MVDLNTFKIDGRLAIEHPEYGSAAIFLLELLEQKQENKEEWIKEAALGRKEDELKQLIDSKKQEAPYFMEPDFKWNLEILLIELTRTFYTVNDSKYVDS